MSAAAASSSSSEVTTLTATGTSCTFSSRLRAVTTISSLACWVVSCGAGSCAGGVASCATAGTATTNSKANTRTVNAFIPTNLLIAPSFCRLPADRSVCGMGAV
jgi:hypothetical protein